MYLKLSFSHFILFYNYKKRHLEFLNLSPQGLISSVINEQATILCFDCQWIAQNVKKTPFRVYVINFDFFDFNVQAHLWLSQIGVYGEHNLPPSC